jgi:negative regulator of sigma E activity
VVFKPLLPPPPPLEVLVAIAGEKQLEAVNVAPELLLQPQPPCEAGIGEIAVVSGVALVVVVGVVVATGVGENVVMGVEPHCE